MYPSNGAFFSSILTRDLISSLLNSDDIIFEFNSVKLLVGGVKSCNVAPQSVFSFIIDIPLKSGHLGKELNVCCETKVKHS